MNVGSSELGREAGAAAWTLPLEDIIPSQPDCSITRYDDIMAVDANHRVFSSGSLYGGIIIGGEPDPDGGAMSIAMDPPKDDVQRKAVSPAVSPANLRALDRL